MKILWGMFFSLIFFVPRGRMGRGAVFVAAVCCLLTVTTVDAQSKKNPKSREGWRGLQSGRAGRGRGAQPTGEEGDGKGQGDVAVGGGNAG